MERWLASLIRTIEREEISNGPKMKPGKESGKEARSKKLGGEQQ